ncbi:MAG: COX aromatic rich motif-containing protein [Candidatus Paceibacterota bacterium]
MKRYFVLPIVAALALLGILVLAQVHGANLAVLYPQGFIGTEERDVIVITALLSSVVVIPVFCLLFWFAWRYRATSSKTETRHRPGWDHNDWVIETVWWVIPTLIIIILSFIALKSAHDLDPYKPIENGEQTITVQVVALNWKWLFIYPEQGIATVNMLEFPEHTPVHFVLTADAPMNSFWIPKLGGQIMVMPGMQTQLNLSADTTGTYNGVSANISGRGFAGMSFVANSVSKEDFDAWVASVKETSEPLTQQTYTELAAPSEWVPAKTYSAVADGLFNAIIMKYMSASMHSMPMTSNPNL